jgi:2-polyprenyl-6-methoxyphenol hydroxylase-like FAD-dependent oxidoreductase
MELRRILIAGGGIAGLTLAAALRQRGFAPELVERSSEWKTVGAGIAVQPNGLRALHALGAGTNVEQAGTVIRHWLFRDHRGELLCDIDLEELWGETGTFLGVEQAKLQTALRAAATGTHCHLGTWITSLSQSDHGAFVRFNDGSEGDYDLVVGADGIASAARELTLSTDPPVYGGQMAWRSVAPIRPGGLTNLQFWLGEGCFFGLCPVGDGCTYGFANVTQQRVHDPVQGRLERLRKLFAGFGDPIQEYLAALESDAQIHCGTIEWLDLGQWHTGRVVLIGDAAHASSPMMGQGGCMAMEDAIVLAEILHAADELESALNAYVTRRRPRVGWVQQQSRATGDGFRLPSDVRNAVLRDRGITIFRERFSPLIPPP